MQNITFVTGIYDLGKRENNPNRRQISDYLQHGNFLLSQDINLYIFCDPELEPYIKSKRKYDDKTVLIPIPFEEWDLFPIQSKIISASLLNPVQNHNPFKDTPLYFLVMWLKFAMLRHAIKDNTFNSTHFAWIDYGITHVANCKYVVKDQIFTKVSEKVKVLMLKNWADNDLKDIRAFLSIRRGLLGCGFMTGNKENMKKFSKLFLEKALELLEQGYASTDEALLPYVIKDNPDLFDLYYGDYEAIFSNYRVHRGSMYCTLLTLITSREAKDWKRGCDVGKRVLESYNDGTLESSDGELSQVLDEYYIAAFYLQNMALAREIAETYKKIALSKPSFREVYLRNKNHIDSNFSFLPNFSMNISKSS